MESISYENHKLEIKNCKFNFKEVCRMLNYESVREDYYLTKQELIEEFEDIKDEEEVKFVEFLKGLDLTEPMLNIYEYMQKTEKQLLENPIFSKLLSAFEKKDQEIYICKDLLQFLGFNLNNFIKFLEKKNISFNIKLNNEIIQNSEPSNSRTKKHLFLTFEKFKSSIMMLANRRSSEIRIYYNKFEETYNSYLSYVNDFKHQQEIDEKNKKIKESKRVNANLSNFVRNVKIKNKNAYIYIATSEKYAAKNTFKIGSTTNLISRLRTYNTGRKQSDLFFYAFFEKVFDVNNVEKVINNILEDFKDKKSKEIVILHYTYLEPLIKLIIKNINEPYEYINDLTKNKLIFQYNLKPIIITPLIVPKDVITLTDLEKQIYSFLDNCIEANDLNLTRKQLLNQLNIENISKDKLWSYIKHILKWKDSKTFVQYKNIDLIISY